MRFRCSSSRTSSSRAVVTRPSSAGAAAARTATGGWGGATGTAGAGGAGGGGGTGAAVGTLLTGVMLSTAGCEPRLRSAARAATRSAARLSAWACASATRRSARLRAEGACPAACGEDTVVVVALCAAGDADAARAAGPGCCGLRAPGSAGAGSAQRERQGKTKGGCVGTVSAPKEPCAHTAPHRVALVRHVAALTHLSVPGRQRRCSGGCVGGVCVLHGLQTYLHSPPSADATPPPRQQQARRTTRARRVCGRS